MGKWPRDTCNWTKSEFLRSCEDFGLWTTEFPSAILPHPMLHLAWVSGSSTPSKMGSMPWWDLSWDDDHPGKSGFNPQISSGWWYTYPSEKYEGQMRVLLHIFRTTMMVTIETGWWFQPLWKIWLRQLGWLFPIWWESQKKHVPNHQPVI